jgi:hypothetical protein
VRKLHSPQSLLFKGKCITVMIYRDFFFFYLCVWDIFDQLRVRGLNAETSDVPVHVTLGYCGTLVQHGQLDLEN